MINYILKRLTEASTIRGLILFLSSIVGISLQTQQVDYAVWIVLGAIGLIGTFLPDRIGDTNTINLRTYTNQTTIR